LSQEAHPRDTTEAEIRRAEKDAGEEQIDSAADDDDPKLRLIEIASKTPVLPSSLLSPH
jgi:hypothetical protein